MAVKELKYPFAFDEQGNVVSANEIDDLIKSNKLYVGTKYFISWEEDGECRTKRLDLIKSKSKRKHFREHRENSENNTRGNITLNKYNETIVHKMAKQIILNREISSIYTPKVEVEFKNGNLCTQQEKCVYMLDKLIESEVVLDDKMYRPDIVITDTNGDILVVEIKVTHGVDFEKAKYLRDNKINAIEIDLSEVYEQNKIVTDEVKNNILAILNGRDTTKTKWISNKSAEELKECINGITKLHMYDTQYKKDRDGLWYVYANDEKMKGNLGMCPHYDKLNDVQSRIYERDCRECPRLLSINRDKKYVVCYHCAYDISKLFDLIYNINT